MSGFNDLTVTTLSYGPVPIDMPFISGAGRSFYDVVKMLNRRYGMRDSTNWSLRLGDVTTRFEREGKVGTAVSFAERTIPNKPLRAYLGITHHDHLLEEVNRLADLLYQYSKAIELDVVALPIEPGGGYTRKCTNDNLRKAVMGALAMTTRYVGTVAPPAPVPGPAFPPVPGSVDDIKRQIAGSLDPGVQFTLDEEGPGAVHVNLWHADPQEHLARSNDWIWRVEQVAEIALPAGCSLRVTADPPAAIVFDPKQQADTDLAERIAAKLKAMYGPTQNP